MQSDTNCKSMFGKNRGCSLFGGAGRPERLPISNARVFRAVLLNGRAQPASKGIHSHIHGSIFLMLHAEECCHRGCDSTTNEAAASTQETQRHRSNACAFVSERAACMPANRIARLRKNVDSSDASPNTYSSNSNGTRLRVALGSTTLIEAWNRSCKAA